MNYLKWDLFVEAINQKKLSYFTLYDLERIFSKSKSGLKKILSRKVKEKKLVRLKRNLYYLTIKPPSEYLIANILYQPSYISLEFALSFYGIIPETVYTITSVTSKPTREFSVNDKMFSYQTIKKQAFVGYLPRSIDGVTVLIATPEKALADYLYFIALGKKRGVERIEWRRCDRQIVRNYLVKNFLVEKNKADKLIS